MKHRLAMMVVLGIALLGTGCLGTRAPLPAAPEAAPPTASMVSAIREAGASADDELDVRPLRDTRVEDLRQQAAAFESARQFKQAADALDQAIALHEADPAVLQERAEIAVLLGDLDGALQFVRRAIERGTDVGPLCRRHWATIEQVAQWRSTQADTAAQAKLDLQTARAKRESCTVAAPPRY